VDAARVIVSGGLSDAGQKATVLFALDASGRDSLAVGISAAVGVTPGDSRSGAG